jgi:hypothetical protein
MVQAALEAEMTEAIGTAKVGREGGVSRGL